jgi:hypothetical protein
MSGRMAPASLLSISIKWRQTLDLAIGFVRQHASCPIRTLPHVADPLPKKIREQSDG